MKNILSIAILGFFLTACAKNDGPAATPPSEVTASGCRLDKPLDVASNTLIRGEANLLVLGGLVFDKTPSGLPLSAMDEMELHLFEQYFFGFGGSKHATGMVGFKLTNIGLGFELGSTPIAPTGGKFTQNNQKNGNVQRHIALRGNDNDPDWKIEVVLKDSSLNALEITHPVIQPNGQRVQETNCLKQARVLQYFQ